MAILNVTQDRDYRSEDLTNVTEIHFSGAFTAIFDQSQFGPGGISNSVKLVRGEEFGATVEVHLTEGMGAFSAAGWNISHAPFIIRFVGTAGADVISGATGPGYADQEFIGGGGVDTLIGGTGDSKFIYDAPGDFAPGEKIDGVLDYDEDTVVVRASVDFTVGTVTNIERLEIVGDGTTATFFREQLRVSGEDFVERQGIRVWGDETPGTVQTLLIKLAPGSDGFGIKYARFFDWGSEDRIILRGGDGSDEIEGSDFADIIETGASADVLLGRKGKDELHGGDGRDRLDGGADNDILTGGADKDAFVFATSIKRGKNVDHITDFQAGVDVIRLERDDFSGLKKGKLAKGAFASGDDLTKAKDGSDRIVYDKTTGALYFDKDGKGNAKAVQFALLEGAPKLKAGDIIVEA